MSNFSFTFGILITNRFEETEELCNLGKFRPFNFVNIKFEADRANTDYLAKIPISESAVAFMPALSKTLELFITHSFKN